MLDVVFLFIIIIILGILLFYKEPFVVTSVIFLNDGNIIATVENSAGHERDFIGPKPEWRGVDDHMKPPKRLQKQLDETYNVWTKYHGH